MDKISLMSLSSASNDPYVKTIPALSFTSLTPLFDTLSELSGYGSRLKRRVAHHLALDDGERLLDVGCGTGQLLLMASETHPASQMVGVDPDPRALLIARRRAARLGRQLEFVMAGGEQLPFPDGSFDVVSSTLAFHHIPVELKPQALREIRRVLKEGGRFLLADFGRAHSPEVLWLVGMMDRLHVPEARSLRENVHGKVPALIREAGFGEIKAVAPRYRGVDFLLCRKGEHPGRSTDARGSR